MAIMVPPTSFQRTIFSGAPTRRADRAMARTLTNAGSSAANSGCSHGANKTPERPDCVARLGGLELRNPGTSHVFEMS
jgi:hypothetical protein